MASCSKNKQVVKYLIKCFCGCTDLTVEEVQRIAMLNVQQTLNDEKAVNIFKSYLKLKTSGSNLLLTEIHLNVYERLRTETLTSEDILSDVANDVEMPTDMEFELAEAIENGNIEHVQRKVLMDCCNLIEESEEYAGYKKELRKKLDKIKKPFKCT